MIISILLVRHGSTKLNEEHRYVGSGLDEDLSPRGIKESEILKDRIDALGVEPGEIYVSPMRRAISTAKIIFGNEIDFDIVDELKEISFGDYEGKNYEELKEEEPYQKYIDSNGEEAFPGGEDKKSFVNRTIKAFNRIVMEAGSENISIVAHGGTVMSIMEFLSGEDYFSFQIPPADGYLVKIKKENEGIHFISYNRIFDRLRA